MLFDVWDLGLAELCPLGLAGLDLCPSGLADLCPRIVLIKRPDTDVLRIGLEERDQPKSYCGNHAKSESRRSRNTGEIGIVKLYVMILTVFLICE